ncbi:MAG: hypothetical protein ACOYLQ_09720 [Hyphomicrobiaceae bacterium]
MPRAPLNPGQWPRLMRAETAAAYVDERSVESFLRRAGKVYPPGRKVSGRGRVWAREDLDRAIGLLNGERLAESLADDL